MKIGKVLFTLMLGLVLVFGFSTVALAEDLSGVKVTTDSANDNLTDFNANRTGEGVGGQTQNQDVIKSQDMTSDDGTTGTQRTHGEYQNNTNSCASCHQTHTAAGDKLLMKNGVTETCTACHDGTLGFYNVFSPSTAGTFEGTLDGNPSVHMVADAAVTLSAAPGGNRDATSGSWTSEFTCSSCHAPHGSYSDRLLNFNPNDIGNTPMYDDAAGTLTGVPNGPTGGLKVADAAVVDTTAGATDDYVVLRTTSDSAELGSNTVTDVTTGASVIVLMKKSGSSYVRDLNPWIDGETHGVGAWTAFEDGTGTELNEELTINYAKGYVTGDSTILDTVTTANIARAVVVKFDFAGNVDDFGGLMIKEVDPSSYENTGYGVQISQFCAACHTDYLAKSSNAPGEGSGIWSKAFRHTTNRDGYTCLKCHFAHGTDASVMLDAQDRDLADMTTLFGGDAAKALAYMKDQNNSSALKRYTNMSVCWKCHTSSHANELINNTWVQGGLNGGVLGSSEYDTSNVGNNPDGWEPPTNEDLPYWQDVLP